MIYQLKIRSLGDCLFALFSCSLQYLTAFRKPPSLQASNPTVFIKKSSTSDNFQILQGESVDSEWDQQSQTFTSSSIAWRMWSRFINTIHRLCNNRFLGLLLVCFVLTLFAPWKHKKKIYTKSFKKKINEDNTTSHISIVCN